MVSSSAFGPRTGTGSAACLTAGCGRAVQARTMAPAGLCCRVPNDSNGRGRGKKVTNTHLVIRRPALPRDCLGTSSRARAKERGFRAAETDSAKPATTSGAGSLGLVLQCPYSLPGALVPLPLKRCCVFKVVASDPAVPVGQGFELRPTGLRGPPRPAKAHPGLLVGGEPHGDYVAPRGGPTRRSPPSIPRLVCTKPGVPHRTWFSSKGEKELPFDHTVSPVVSAVGREQPSLRRAPAAALFRVLGGARSPPTSRSGAWRAFEGGPCQWCPGLPRAFSQQRAAGVVIACSPVRGQGMGSCRLTPRLTGSGRETKGLRGVEALRISGGINGLAPLSPGGSCPPV